jgi:raffinose/stachyose/melibiose transport system substrate-binding protein
MRGNLEGFGIPEACRQFIEYLSSAEICSKIATVSGDIPGLIDAENEDAYVTQAFRETCALYEGDIQYVPLFDREYLPSGMWDDLGVALTKIIMDPGSAIEESVTYLQEAYTTKMASNPYG